MPKNLTRADTPRFAIAIMAAGKGTRLKWACAASEASRLRPGASSWARGGQGDRGSGGGKHLAAITPDSLPKAWSVDKIHRRWAAVRGKMKEAQLDCLLVCQHHPGEMIAERQDGDADIEYLTGITLPFKWVILPIEGKVTALSTNQVRGAREEKLAQERGIDVRMVDAWSAGIIDAMKEANAAQGRIGVTALLGASRHT